MKDSKHTCAEFNAINYHHKYLFPYTYFEIMIALHFAKLYTFVDFFSISSMSKAHQDNLPTHTTSPRDAQPARLCVRGVTVTVSATLVSAVL